MQAATNSEIIYAAALGLHNDGRQISRPNLCKVTGLGIGIVDDHVTRLVENGRARRVAKGVIELVEVFPPNRAISKTVLPDGSITIEMGDLVLQLTPGEAQVLGANLIGEATVFSQLRGDRDQQDAVARLEARSRENATRMENLAREVAALRNMRQAALAF